MKEKLNYNTKYLNHRLYGYLNSMFTQPTFENAILSGAPYIEIDIRFSKDRIGYVYHDPKTKKQELGKRVKINKVNSDKLELLRFPDNQKMLKLDKAIKLFKSLKKKNQYLCLDIKDLGAERQIDELISSHDLIDSIVIISWIPRVLINFHEIGSKLPLFLSHINLVGSKSLFAKSIYKFLKNRILRLSDFVLIGEKKYADSLLNYQTGFQHALFLTEIPSKLKMIIKDSDGGVCISKKSINQKLTKYLQDNEIRFWVFSMKDKNEYDTFSKIHEVERLFCDFSFN